MELTKEKEVRAAILELIKRLSKEQLATIKPDAVATEIEKKRDLRNDHWVSSILLTTPKASVCFRVHFASEVGKQLAIDAFGGSVQEFSLEEVQDYLKEYCNIVVGRAKQFLVNSDDDKGGSHKTWLPEVKPAYDEFGVLQDEPSQVIEEMWWKLEWEKQEMVLYAKVKVLAGFSMQSIKELKKQTIISVVDDGSVELF